VRCPPNKACRANSGARRAWVPQASTSPCSPAHLSPKAATRFKGSTCRAAYLLEIVSIFTRNAWVLLKFRCWPCTPSVALGKFRSRHAPLRRQYITGRCPTFQSFTALRPSPHYPLVVTQSVATLPLEIFVISVHSLFIVFRGSLHNAYIYPNWPRGRIRERGVGSLQRCPQDR
jgi:hypothetical protein